MKLSVAIATYNEEKNIGRCLASIADWVSEIVVVDGSSADRTPDIAREYKARVIKTDNPPIFHINKQKAIDECKGDWILQLDADEIVTPQLKDEILAKINQKSEINGYWLPRKNFFLGRFLKKGGQYPDYTMRLYKKGKGKLPCKSVHEQAVIEGKVDYLKNPLEHYPYASFSHYIDHFNRYTDLIAQELNDQKIPTGFSSFLKYMIFLPKLWFLKTFLRHKGFEDGFAGFVFSLFSSLRFPTSYIKYWESKRQKISL